MEALVKKIGPWIPLLIAAGYFAFLVATYVKVVGQLKVAAVAEPVVEAKPES